MTQKIVSVEVSKPGEQAEETVQAGNMFEHNATQLQFILDDVYLQGDYRFYAEFVTAKGVARTAYLAPANGAVTVSLPLEITAQMTAMCVLNVVQISADGKTEQLIKAKKVRLYFSNLDNTDAILDANHAFSVNQLLEAVYAGTFRGEQGVQGIQGEKGEKGDKGEPAVPIENAVTENGENPVAAAGIYSFVAGRTPRVIASVELGEGESIEEIVINLDRNGKPFSLRELRIFAVVQYTVPSFGVTLRIRTDVGARYLTMLTGIRTSGILTFHHTAETVEGVLSVGRTIYGTAGQGVSKCDRVQSICTTKTDPFTNIRFALYEDGSNKNLIPMLQGTKVVIVGTDAE